MVKTKEQNLFDLFLFKTNVFLNLTLNNIFNLINVFDFKKN